MFFNSGSFISIEIQLVDEKNSTFKQDSKTKASIEFYDQDKVSSFNKIIGGSTIADEGVYKFENMKVIQRPGTTEYIQVKLENLDLFNREA